MPLSDNPRLTQRLLTVAAMVPRCCRLIDIGTDHAGLPIELVNQCRCKEALAIDIRLGPLAMAEQNIRRAGLTDHITTQMTNGLSGIALDKDDAVVIAGMGGYEMMQILGTEPRTCLAIILQPMKSLPELRTWLCSNGYAIEDEQLAVEAHRIYVILRCRYTGQSTTLSPMETLVGPVLLVSQPDGFAVYLTRLLTRLKKQNRGQPELGEVIQKIQNLEAKIHARSKL